MKRVDEKSKILDYYEKNPEKLLKGLDSFSNYSYDVVDSDTYRKIFNLITHGGNFPENLDTRELQNEFTNKILKLYPKVKNKFPDIFKSEEDFKRISLEELLYYAPSKEKFKLLYKERFKIFKENIPEVQEYLQSIGYEDLIEDYYKRYATKENARMNYMSSKIKKISAFCGLKPHDFLRGVAEILRMQSSSYQRPKSELYPILQYLTVVKSKLPKVIYRGFFYDGAKIKDREKFLSKWYKGSKPGESFSKPTSWSTSRSVAVAFMDNQDRVKDSDGGFHIIVKLENPTVEEVIADYRNFKYSGYYNQLELLINSGIKRYVVDEILPGGDRSKFWDYRTSNTKSFASASGSSLTSLGLSLFDLGSNSTDFSIDDLINIGQMKEILLKDFSGKSRLYVQSGFQNCLLPVVLFYINILHYFPNSFDTVSKNKNTIEFNFSARSLNELIHRMSEQMTQDTSGLKQLAFEKYSDDSLVSMELKLLSNELRNFRFSLKIKETSNLKKYKITGDIDLFIETLKDNLKNITNKKLERYKNVKVIIL